MLLFNSLYNRVNFMKIIHYENLPMQYTRKFSCKISDNFKGKNAIFNTFAQNIYCMYTLESPRIVGIKNKKKRYTPVNRRFTV